MGILSSKLDLNYFMTNYLEDVCVESWVEQKARPNPHALITPKLLSGSGREVVGDYVEK